MMSISPVNKIAMSLVALCIFSMPIPAISETETQSVYMARQESVNGIFDAISSAMRKPVILSKLAARKKVTGEFDLSRPQDVLVTVSEQLGLIWYSDGQAIYVYDATEMRNAVIVLRNISFSTLENFLKNAGLHDPRFPLRSDNLNATFYVSGPPIYVDLITSTAKYLDQQTVPKVQTFNGQESIAVIPLHNTFVEDRTYNFRGEKLVIPGMATNINRIIGTGHTVPTSIKAPPRRKAIESELDMSDFPQDVLESYRETDVITPPAPNAVNVVPDAGSNSLLVRGTPEQVEYIRNLASTLDVAKRHIELSVWIVDLSKEAFNNLGVQWTGNFNISGANMGISLNGGTSTIDGASFMVTALALSEKNQANIVSRPMILTQENIPAIFDNSRTFYTSLLAERVAQLDHVTFGTSVSVLPRFTKTGEIEMMLNVEDGNQFDNTRGNDLPDVGRTNISTIARVPKGKSLLIGGYVHDEKSSVNGKIPLLGDIPLMGRLFRYTRDRESSMVRVFLIQPREIDAPLSPDAHTVIADMRKDLGSDQLQNWMNNYLDSQKWR